MEEAITEEELEEAKSYLKLVRQRFSTNDNYVAFQQALKAFAVGEIEFPALLSKVDDLFKPHHDDLRVQFNRFLPVHQGSSSRKAPPKRVKRSRSPQRHDLQRRGKYDNCDSIITSDIHEARGIRLSVMDIKEFELKKSACHEFFDRVKKNLGDDHQKNRSFVELLIEYRKHKDIDRLDKEVSSLFKENPELYIEFTAFLVDAIEAKFNNLKERNDLDQEEPMIADVDEFDVKHFTVKKKKPHDRLSFQCEDAMYVADMLYHGMKSVKRAAETLLGEAENTKGKMKVHKFYTPANLRFVRYFYGDTSEDDKNSTISTTCAGKKVVESLRENPVSTSLILRCRFNEERLKEVDAWRHEFKKSWAERLNSCSGKAQIVHATPAVKKENI